MSFQLLFLKHHKTNTTIKHRISLGSVMNLNKLIEQYKDVIPYAVFGVLTTLVNIISYWVCAHLLSIPVMPSTVIAWILAVLFAYLTNRTWVFHSKAQTINELSAEIVSFFACRLATGFVDWGLMFVLVDRMGLADVPVKAVANIVVIILNYLASKLIIFK